MDETNSVSLKAFVGILFAGAGILIPMMVLFILAIMHCSILRRVSKLEEKVSKLKKFK